MPLVDSEIRKLCLGAERMITPFSEAVDLPGQISYGLSEVGYDIRLKAGELWVFSPAFGEAISPKKMKDPAYRERVFIKVPTKPHDVVTIPANGYVLGTSYEYFRIPRWLSGEVGGKSTYARCGVAINVTTMEPEWCMADDTEILTEEGWRLLAQVDVGDSVLTRREDGQAEYQPVVAKQAMPYKGDLLHFAGRSVDQLVTPDHGLFVHRVVQSAGERGLVAGKVRAAEVFGRHNFRFDRAVRWSPEGTDPNQIYLAGRSWDAGDFLEFYGSWLGDGSAYLGSDGGYHIKLAVVTKEDKRRAFKAVLDKLRIKHTLQERGFHFYDKALCNWLRQHGHAHDKHVRREVMMTCGPALLERLLQGLMQSDGCALTNTYTTVSRQLADDVQEIIFKCGRAAIVRRVDESGPFGGTGRYIIRDCNDHMTPLMRPERHRLHSYDGMVYDVTVPNSVFFCRRGGKASWTGNCGELTIEIRNDGGMPVELYVMEGIAKVRFFRNEGHLERSYKDKGGKYQNQIGVTPASVRSE